MGPTHLSHERFLRLGLRLAPLDTFAISPWLRPEWIRTLPDEEKASILARAQQVLEHCFDLLGSGPTPLGTPIPWRQDFKSGREWPLDPIEAIVISYPDGSDIKVPWELSRFQHLPLLGQAWWLTGDPAYPKEFADQLESWWRQNPLEKGPNWACTMDVAMRAASWITAAWQFQDAPLAESFWQPFYYSLYLHGRFIRRHLEDSPPHGNHYLADLVGLLYLGALFDPSPEGWWEFAQAALEAQILEQIHPDGVDHEGSLAYHRLVTEMLLAADHLAELAKRPFSDAFRDRLARMRLFSAHYLREDGRAPRIGDADNGRWLFLSDYGRFEPEDHRHLFTDWGDPLPPAAGSGAFPDGGFFVLRHGPWHLTVHAGKGGHGHNDLLAFELAYGPYPLILDSGTWLYTADPEGRNRFRQTDMHATLQVDGREQNPIDPDLLFQLPDQAQARCLKWEDSPEAVRFVGCHDGYRPIRHQREIVLDKVRERIVVLDTVQGSGRHDLTWSFPFADLPFRLGDDGSLETQATDRPNFRLQIEEREGLSWEVVPSWHSPSYGVQQSSQRLCYRWQGNLPVTVRFEVSLT